MTDPYIGEIKIWAFSWAPQHWMFCDGSILQIGQNAALFSLLGVQFGGDGQKTFAVPDLRGRIPVGTGIAASQVSYRQGASGGAEAVTLNINTVPPHAHQLNAATEKGTSGAPTANFLSTVVPGVPSTVDLSSYKGTGWTADTTLNPASISTAGGNAPHSNMQPFTVVNYCICTVGLYPSRN